MAERLSQLFDRLRAEGRAALLPYLMLGYPDPDISLAAAKAALLAGADGLELGIPFSDPLADGPTIQHAGDIALSQGMNLTKAFEMVAELRKLDDEAPFFLMSYLNPLLAYGLEDLCQRAAEVGIDGLIVPDLPLEEEGALADMCSALGLSIIHLVAPTSSDQRIGQIAGHSQGMLYLVSVTGVTGTREALPVGLDGFVQRVRDSTNLPVAVGFGISTPEQARRVGMLADGIIVGSALIRHLASDGVDGVAAFVRSLRQALTRSPGSDGQFSAIEAPTDERRDSQKEEQ